MVKPVLADWLTRPNGIAERLRGLRANAGLLGKDLATHASWPTSKISKLENGRQLPTADDLRHWTQACGAPEALDDLLELLDEVHSAHLDWNRRFSHGLGPIQTTFVDLVEHSTVVKGFETVFVPGLLQIPDYARVVLEHIAELNGHQSTTDLEAAVAERMRRQQYLYQPGRRFELLIAEPVLRWLIVPPSTMRAQLDRLAATIGMPNVRLGILPLGTRLAIAPQNKFELYDDTAIVETFVGETTHDTTTSQTYHQIMDRLWDHAATGDNARHLIIKAATDLANTTDTEQNGSP